MVRGAAGMRRSEQKNVVSAAGGQSGPTGMSRLETLPDALISKLRRQEFTIGETIGGRYRLKSLLGVGAMGQVFVAENTAISVDVAVKLLKPELIANPEFRQRFQKEAEAIGSISHPNVARFFDLVVGDPTFLVMEYVRGPTLQQIIEENTRLEVDRALSIATRLCWGLQAAHARGIVHRDLKPANIIVGSDVEVGEQPVIIDFGLAKLATTTELTRTGQLLGTPEYMAPEQIEGKKIDARTDVYALGCVLYKMLAGHAPFAGEDVVQVLYRQVHEAPQPLTDVIPDISPKVVAVLSRALAKNPDDRYPDTRDFARALARAHDRRQSSGSDSQTSFVSLPPRQTPIALIAATTLAVGAVVGMLIARLKWGPAVASGMTEPANAKAAPAPTPSSELLVVTTPEAATVEVDGKKQGERTPTTLRGLSAGPHTVRLAASGTATVERNVTVPADGRASLVVNLPTAQHNVVVRSMPAGATVYFDDQLAGTAPATIAVTEDDFHELRIEKLGYATLTHAIKPDDKDTELTLSMEIDPTPHSEISVDSSAEAEIWLDGVNTTVETPAMGLRVAPGRHTLQLKDSSGSESKRITIEPRPGETLHVVLNL
jgi:serine/threonine protein kinase